MRLPLSENNIKVSKCYGGPHDLGAHDHEEYGYMTDLTADYFDWVRKIKKQNFKLIKDIDSC